MEKETNKMFSSYLASILRVLVFISWMFIFRKKNSTFSQKNIKYFLWLMGIFIFWNTFALISHNRIISIYIYIVFWAVISVFSFLFFIDALFFVFKAGKRNKVLFLISVSILSMLSIFAAIFTHYMKSYIPINTIDFYNSIILIICVLAILKQILSQDSFIENIESFFIFTGFTLYFGLHILASNVTNIDFIKNWGFGQIATIASLIYWIGSGFLIWKIRSSYSL